MTMDIGIGCRWHQQSSTPPVLNLPHCFGHGYDHGYWNWMPLASTVFNTAGVEPASLLWPWM
jgi:hypothetical protein